MNGTPPTDCPRTDAVLAIYLDGDVGADGRQPQDSLRGSGFELVCGDSLRDHLLGCATCRQQLQRARRLDAMLAAQAGRTVGGRDLDALAQRCFAAIEAVPVSTEPHAVARPRAAAFAFVFAALLAASAWVLCWSLATTASPVAPPAPADGPIPVPPVAPIAPARAEPPAPAAALREILIAGDAAHRRARQPRAETPSAEATVAALQRVLGDATLAVAVRRDAAAHLLATARGARSENPTALPRLIETVAGLGDHDADTLMVHHQVLDLVRADAQVTTQLLTHVQRLEARRSEPGRDDLAALTVAARLGDRQLDASLQRAVRRHAWLAEPLAAALRAPVRRRGSAQLLLDVWQDRSARGDHDETTPCRWFQNQPVTVFAELEQLLRTACSAPRRVQCLLALGQGSDARSLAVLVEQVQQAPFLEAHAAAFALSQRPRRDLEPLVPQARGDEQYLLRAALARAGVAAATTWIDALALDAVQRRELATGPCADFPRLANWFRARGLSFDD